ncbi:hypothetical protein [Listeria riparia]|uniref:Putative collagen adhesion protein n=1 Tax=Listeria riparia FSL S10-1204 TaxID=1265816 RepID=W7D154_9LIST|nr:hypothetical protein [Listeria riparia]EUJ42862.1 putative collagen adhesion protein [Listeria riparia FSL S10-1204]
MANMSNAFGTITIPAKIMEKYPNELVSLIQLMESELVRIDYNTILSDEYPQICAHIQNTTIPHDFILGFTGTGKWTYATNVRGFFESLLPVNELTADFSWLQTLFQEKESVLTFSFLDYEQGAEILYNATFQIRPCIYEKHLATEVVYEHSEDLDLTAANLMACEFYEQAYDRHNAHELINNDEFMMELSVFIPRNFITEAFLTDAWSEYVLYVYDDESIFDQVIQDIVAYYHHTHSLKA